MWMKQTYEDSWASMTCCTSVEAAGWCHCKVTVTKIWAVLVTAQVLMDSPQGRQGILPLCLALVRCIRSAECCSGLPSTRETWVQWSEASKGIWRWGSGAWQMRGAESSVTVLPGAGGYSGQVWCGACRRLQRRKTRSSLVLSSDWMRRKGHKLKYKKFHLSVRGNKIFFSLYIGVGQTLEQISYNPWKLPSVQMFSIWLDVLLGTLIELT